MALGSRLAWSALWRKGFVPTPPTLEEGVEGVATFTVGRRCRAVRGVAGPAPTRPQERGWEGGGLARGGLAPAGPGSWGLGCARVRADGVGHPMPPSLTTVLRGKSPPRGSVGESHR